jgi:arginase
MIICLGIPLDENSSYLKGAALAPEKIRDAFYCDSTNRFTEDNIDVTPWNAVKDAGDLKLSEMPKAFSEIESAVYDHVISRRKVISLGGDHSITYPVIKAFARKYQKLNILHIDAHADLYDEFEHNRYSHACPFARIMEEDLAKRLVQIGIRTLNPHQRDQIRRYDVETIEMKDWSDDYQFRFDGPVYVSIDLDALDPAFAPGVSHYEPGGFSTRQLINVIQKLRGNLIGADIVELNPSRDINGMTAMAAAKLFKELIAKMLRET